MPKTLQTTLARAGVPLVLLARTVPGLRADIVEIDDKRAAYEGVTHLLRLGYRRVGFITGLRGATRARRRLDGYARRCATGRPTRSGARSSKAISASNRATAPASSCSKTTSRRGVHLELPDDASGS